MSKIGFAVFLNGCFAYAEELSEKKKRVRLMDDYSVSGGYPPPDGGKIAIRSSSSITVSSPLIK